MVVTVTTQRTNCHYSDTLTILKGPAAAAESVLLPGATPSGSILGQTELLAFKSAGTETA